MTTEPMTDQFLDDLRSLVANDALLVAGRNDIARLIATIDTLRERAEKAGSVVANVDAILASGDRDVIRCREGGGPEDVGGSIVLTILRTRHQRDAAESERDLLRQEVERLRAADLAAACKPWEFHVGEPPADDSPLSAVYGAGMHYTEELLASLIGVTHYEPGDGSEDFRTDAGQTLMNILTAAGLYDEETGRFAALTSKPTRAGKPAGPTHSTDEEMP